MKKMNKAKIKKAFADGLAVIDGDGSTSGVWNVVDNSYWRSTDKANEELKRVFRMVLAEENTDKIMLELKTIVDEAFERVSDEILETFED